MSFQQPYSQAPKRRSGQRTMVFIMYFSKVIVFIRYKYMHDCRDKKRIKKKKGVFEVR